MEVLDYLLSDRSNNSTLEVALLWREFKSGTPTSLLEYLSITRDEKNVYIDINQVNVNKIGMDIVVNWLRNNFPNKRFNITYNEAIKMFESLREYKPIWDNMPFNIVNMNRKGDRNLFDKKPLLLVIKPEYYFNFNMLTEYFMDIQRMGVRRKDTKESPLDEYEHNTKKFVVACLSTYHKINAYLLRETIWKNTHEATEFKASIMCAMIDLFNAKRVIDFSAGRGARLIGCIAKNIPYTGIDPDSNLTTGYKEIIDMLGGGNTTKYRIIKGRAQDKKIYKDINEKYDLCFTSPPYFDLEDYSKENTQSIVEFNTVDKWLNGFLIPSVMNIISVMENGGNIVININDPGLNVPRRQIYTEKMVELLNKDKRLHYRGVIGYSEGKATQPMWVWRYVEK